MVKSCYKGFPLLRAMRPGLSEPDHKGFRNRLEGVPSRATELKMLVEPPEFLVGHVLRHKLNGQDLARGFISNKNQSF